MMSVRPVRWAVTVAALSSVLALAACGSNDTSTATSSAETSGSATAAATTGSGSGDPARIAFFTDSLDNAYLQAGVDEAKQTAQENGAQLDVISAGWDANTQLSQVQDAIASGKYDALVVESVDGQTLCNALTKAAQDMVVSIYNAPICGHFQDLYSPGTIGFFGRNEFKSGQMLGEEAAKAIGGKGTLAYVSGPTQVGIVKTTTDGLKDALKKYPDVKLVSEVDGGWDPAKGLAATQDILQGHPDVDGIVYGVDQMAVPSIKWMQSSGKLDDGPKIVTLGGTEQGFKYIRDGVIAASVNSLPREEAGYAVQAAIQSLAGKPIDVPGWDEQAKVYDVLQDPNQPALVTKDNVDQLKAEWDV